MRINSITEVSTHQQQNPYLTQSAGTLSASRNTSGKTFAECLSPYMHQISEPVVTRQMEHQVVGILWGYCPTLRVSPKTETKHEDNDN